MKARALLCLALLAGCADGKSYVHVTVTGNVGDIDHLAVHVLNGGQTANVTFAPGAPFQLPYDFALSFDKSRHGAVTLGVEAWAPDHLIASGTVSTTISPSHGTDVGVSLEAQVGGDLGGVADLSIGSTDLATADLSPPADLLGATPTVGDNVVEANTDNHANGLADASNFLATRNGTLTSLSVYLSAGDPTELLIGLYDDMNDHPHMLLAQGTVTVPIAGQWNTVAISPTAVTQGTPYWIALVAPVGYGSSFTFPYGTGAQAPTTTEHSSQSNLTALPSSWSTGQTFPGTFCSFYASP